MRLHSREEIVTKASLDLQVALTEWTKNHPELTSAEFLKVLLGTCHDRAKSLLKIEIRYERHGDANKPGGAE
jgi:hypothetical protein